MYRAHSGKVTKRQATPSTSLYLFPFFAPLPHQLFLIFSLLSLCTRTTSCLFPSVSFPSAFPFCPPCLPFHLNPLQAHVAGPTPSSSPFLRSSFLSSRYTYHSAAIPFSTLLLCIFFLLSVCFLYPSFFFFYISFPSYRQLLFIFS